MPNMKLIMENWRGFLKESKHDVKVRHLSFEMMQYIKSGETEDPFITDITIKNHNLIDPDDEFDDPETWDDVEVTLDVLRDPEWGIPFTLNGGASGDAIELNLTINPEYEPNIWSDINIELHDAIRHEIEHITQDRNPSKGLKDSHQESTLPYAEYLLLPHEIPAFVNGFNARRKKMKSTLTQAIDDFLVKHRAMFTNGKEDQEIEKVRQIWLDWAKENLPNTPM